LCLIAWRVLNGSKTAKNALKNALRGNISLARQKD